MKGHQPGLQEVHGQPVGASNICLIIIVPLRPCPPGVELGQKVNQFRKSGLAILGHVLLR